MRLSRPSTSAILAVFLAASLCGALPCFFLSHIVGGAPSGRVIRAAAPLFRVLIVPPERFREHMFGQLPTFIIVDAQSTPDLWWLRPPVFFRMAMRHILFAVPFWFTVFALVYGSITFLASRLREAHP